MNIDEYIASQMQDKIVRRNNSPLLPAAITVIGAAALATAFTVPMSDSQQTGLIAVGFLVAAAGLVWTLMCLSGNAWHYHYLPTNCAMSDRKLYIAQSDFQHCTDCLNRGDLQSLGSVTFVPSGNLELRLVSSRDGAIALLQAGRADSTTLEPTTDVIVASGPEVAHLSALKA